MTFLCIEIVGEPSFHKVLIQSGYSGKDYHFHYNSYSRSHLRAYRSREIYLAERVDMHKAANIWPLMPNFFPADQIEKQCWTTPEPEKPVAPGPVLEASGEEDLWELHPATLRKKARDLGIDCDSMSKTEIIAAIQAKE